MPMGEANIRSPHPSGTPQPISTSCQIYHYVPQRIDVQNLVGIDSAVTDLVKTTVAESHNYHYQTTRNRASDGGSHGVQRRRRCYYRDTLEKETC